jgi:hypothetical protein
VRGAGGGSRLLRRSTRTEILRWSRLGAKTVGEWGVGGGGGLPVKAPRSMKIFAQLQQVTAQANSTARAQRQRNGQAAMRCSYGFEKWERGWGGGGDD